MPVARPHRVGRHLLIRRSRNTTPLFEDDLLVPEHPGSESCFAEVQVVLPHSYEPVVIPELEYGVSSLHEPRAPVPQGTCVVGLS